MMENNEDIASCTKPQHLAFDVKKPNRKTDTQS